MWRPCLLTDQDEMSNLYRGPSIDASYQVLVHLVKRFQRRRFKNNRPIRNKNCLWWPCLLMDRDKMSNLYRGPTIYASYQVSVHMVEGFQRSGLKCEKLTDDRRRTPSDGKKLTLPLARWAKKNNKVFFSLFFIQLQIVLIQLFQNYRSFITLYLKLKPLVMSQD